jgi:peptide/nickel transport system ATP-binding protein
MSVRPLVEVINLDFAYRQGEGWARVLHGVNFVIYRGEAFGLVGESGCGKSTVAYQLLAYRRDNSRIEGGRIIFREEDLKDLDRPALDRLRGNRISLVPQNPTTALSPGMRVGRQLIEVLQFHDSFKGREARRVEDLFQLVGLRSSTSIGDRYPHQLSGGQQQRVCIAMALACEPDLIVLDEPTTGLDVTTQEQIVELLKSLRARLGMSMLYVTHDLGVLAQIADRVGVMYAGRMVETATTGELFARPRHPYTRGLIASIPQIEKTNRSAGIALRGFLKRDQLPAGCPFQPRCDFAEPECASEVQVLETVDEGHAVACRRWRDITAVQMRSASTKADAAREIRPDHILSVEGIRLGYGSHRKWLRFSPPADVVQDLSFAIEEGETFALVGESGSGKSTVARAVSGLLAPKGGIIRFEGQVLPPLVADRSRELRRSIQYIFQNPDASLNPRARIGTILSRPVEMFFNPGRNAIVERIAEALDDVRLDASYAARFPDQLSGGERQRVAIARALVANSKLLLCDEILSGLDVSVQANVLFLLQRLRREHNLSMLFISHDLAVVRNLADRVGVLFRGRLMEVGDVEEIFKPPFHPYTYELLMAVPSIRRASRPRLQSRADKAATGKAGCAFAGRCQWQLGAICDQQSPPWREVSPRHGILCHIPLSELTTRVRDDLAHLSAQASPGNQKADPFNVGEQTHS